MKPADLISLLLLSVFSGLLLIYSVSGNPGKEIIVETPDLRMRYSLRKDRIIKVKGKIGISEIEIRNGKVRMTESACPHQLCVKKGWTDRTGDSIVCLPNRVKVLVIGGREEVDAITQ